MVVCRASWGDMSSGFQDFHTQDKSLLYSALIGNEILTLWSWVLHKKKTVSHLKHENLLHEFLYGLIS